MPRESACLHVHILIHWGSVCHQPYVCDWDHARPSESNVLMPVFQLTSPERWSLSLLLFQSEWVWWLLCCVKYGRSDSVPVFWAKILRDCSLSFLCIRRLAPGEASCSVRSRTTLRLPCWEEAQDTWSERFVRREGGQPVISARCSTCEEKPSGDSSFRWEARALRAMRDYKNMLFWATKFWSGWLFSIR